MSYTERKPCNCFIINIWIDFKTTLRIKVAFSFNSRENLYVDCDDRIFPNRYFLMCISFVCVFVIYRRSDHFAWYVVMNQIYVWYWDGDLFVKNHRFRVFASNNSLCGSVTADSETSDVAYTRACNNFPGLPSDRVARDFISHW